MSTARPIRATRSMMTQPSAPKPVASVSRGENDVSAQRSVRSAPHASARTPSSFQVVDGVNSEEAVEPVEPAVDAIWSLERDHPKNEKARMVVNHPGPKLLHR